MSAEETSEEQKRRGVSMWLLAIPIALTLAAGALAYFLLAPHDDDLMATTDQNAVAVAVANAKPSPPAFTPPPAETPPPQ